MTWADILVDVAAPQVALAEFNAFLDSVFEGAAQQLYIDRGVIERTVYRKLPVRIKAVTIHGSFTA